LVPFKKGTLTITEIENNVFVIEFDGILELLIMDEQG